MLDDRTAAQQSTISYNVQAAIPAAVNHLTLRVAPNLADARRLALLMEHVGDLAGELGRGHQDIDSSLVELGGQIHSWLLAREQARSR
jgi:hypothetical protein